MMIDFYELLLRVQSDLKGDSTAYELLSTLIKRIEEVRPPPFLSSNERLRLWNAANGGEIVMCILIGGLIGYIIAIGIILYFDWF